MSATRVQLNARSRFSTVPPVEFPPDRIFHSLKRYIEEDLIICIAIWTLYKLCRPLVSDELRVRSIAPRNELRVTSLLGLVFKGFGRPNGFPNSVFEVFFDVIFHRVWTSNFGRLFEAPSQKNNDFPWGKQWFLRKLCSRWKYANCLILPSFSRAKTKKILSKFESKNMLFWSIEFEGFFLEF